MSRRVDLVSIFETYIEDELGGYDNLFESKFAVVQTALLEARARVAAKINARNPDILSRLPPEVHARCFRTLSFFYLIDMTHVCHTWRTVALSHRPLWANINGDILKDDSRPQIMEVLVARAGPTAPVRISGVDNRMRRLVERNGAQFTRISGSFDLNFHFDMRNLVVLECSDLVLAENWGGHEAPHLTTITARTIHIPDRFTPVPTLKSLVVDYQDQFPAPGVRRDLRRVPDIFPNLKNLSLYSLSDSKTKLPEVLPATLEELHLVGNIDLSPYLKLWCTPARRLRRLGMELGSQQSLILTIEYLLASFGDGPWGMSLSTRNSIELSMFSLADRDGLKITLKDNALERTTIHTALQEYPEMFDRLTFLAVSNVTVTRLQLSSVRFVALTDLDLSMPDTSPVAWNPPPAHPPSVCAPNLRRLVVYDQFEMVAIATVRNRDAATAALLAHVEFSSEEKLESITLASSSRSAFDVCDWSGVMARTHCVLFREFSEPRARRRLYEAATDLW